MTSKNYELQKMYQQKIETNRDEFKFKKSQKYMLIHKMN